jgi:hypothetical protein
MLFYLLYWSGRWNRTGGSQNRPEAALAHPCASRHLRIPAHCDFAQRFSAARRAPAMDGRREILALSRLLSDGSRGQAAG